MTVPKIFRKNKRIILALLLISICGRMVAGFLPYQVKSVVNYSPEEGNVNITGTLNIGYWMACIQQLNSTINQDGERLVDLNYKNCKSLTYRNEQYSGIVKYQGYFISSIVLMLILIFDYYFGYTKSKTGERNFLPILLWIILLFTSCFEIATFHVNAAKNVRSNVYTKEHNTTGHYFSFHRDWGFYLTIASGGFFLLLTLFLIGFYKF